MVVTEHGKDHLWKQIKLVLDTLVLFYEIFRVKYSRGLLGFWVPGDIVDKGIDNTWKGITHWTLATSKNQLFQANEERRDWGRSVEKNMIGSSGNLGWDFLRSPARQSNLSETAKSDKTKYLLNFCEMGWFFSQNFSKQAGPWCFG